MQVVYGTIHRDNIDKGACVGLGNFDGLHIGHMTLINTLINEGKINKLSSIVYTFANHPENLIRKELVTPLITPISKKVELLELTGLDYLFLDDFDDEFSRMMPYDFVKRILVDKLNIKVAVVGFDYRFGYKAGGSIDYLIQTGCEFGFKVIVIPPVRLDNETVSSTLIRNCITNGDMEKAFRLLSRHYSISGRVNNGKKLGSRLGFPTANIYPDKSLLLPKKGVYYTKTQIDKEIYNSITNVGTNPTFSNNNDVVIETNIFDFNKHIYNENIEVSFISRIRDEIKFDSKEQLMEQVTKDMEEARRRF